MKKGKELMNVVVALLVILTYIILIDIIKPKVYITIDRVTTLKTISFNIENYPVAIIFVNILSAILLYKVLQHKRLSIIAMLPSIILLNKNLFSLSLVLSFLLSLLSLAYYVSVNSSELNNVLNHLCYILIVLGLASLIPYVIYPLIGGEKYRGLLWLPTILQLYLYYTLQPALIAVLATLPYLTLIKVLLPYRIKVVIVDDKKKILNERNTYKNTTKLGSKTCKVILAISVAIAFLSNLYPYSPIINPQQKPVGVDTIHYAKALKQANKNFYEGIFSFARGSRPLFMIILYFFQKAFNLSPQEAAMYFPSILLPLLVVSVYCTVKTLGDEEVAALTAFFTATGYKTTVGIYSSFQANLLALTLAYPLTATLFKKTDTTTLLTAAILVFMLDYIHPWTLVQAVTAMLFTALFFKRNGGNIKVLVVSMFSLLIADTLKKIFNAIGATQASQGIAATSIGLNYLLKFSKEIVFSTAVLYGGLILTPLLLITFLFFIFSSRKQYFVYLSAWILTALPLIVSNSAIQSRLYYNIPVEIAYALSLKKIENRKYLMLATIIALNYLMQGLANLHYIHCR